MRRGEVWWARLPPPAGDRPVLLLSRDAAYRVRASITVAAITRRVRGIPTEVSLGPQDGMQRECVVNLDQIATIPRTNLDRRITALSGEKMTAVAEAIKFALDFD